MLNDVAVVLRTDLRSGGRVGYEEALRLLQDLELPSAFRLTRILTHDFGVLVAGSARVLIIGRRSSDQFFGDYPVELVR